MHASFATMKIFKSYYDVENRYKTVYTLRLKAEKEIPLMTVEGIELKGQADLISITVPLEVLVKGEM